MASIDVRADHSIIFLSDSCPDDWPSIDGTRRPPIWASDTCIAIGTLMSDDGPTQVDLRSEGESGQVASGLIPAWSGELLTRSRVLVLTDAPGRRLASRSVSEAVRLTIFTNDPSEPDRVLIVIG